MVRCPVAVVVVVIIAIAIAAVTAIDDGYSRVEPVDQPPPLRIPIPEAPDPDGRYQFREGARPPGVQRVRDSLRDRP